MSDQETPTPRLPTLTQRCELAAFGGKDFVGFGHCLACDQTAIYAARDHIDTLEARLVVLEAENVKIRKLYYEFAAGIARLVIPPPSGSPEDYPSMPSDDELVEKVAGLTAERERLRAALDGLFKLVEDGTLVRDVVSCVALERRK